MSRCHKCSEWLYRNHECPPSWIVWDIKDGESDSSPVYGEHADAAAEAWAELVDSDECGIANGTVIIAAVRLNEDDSITTHHRVRGEWTPQYDSREVTIETLKEEMASSIACGRIRDAGRIYGYLMSI